jgi:dihydroorotate dehydrogenase electron transfer subunit
MPRRERRRVVANEPVGPYRLVRLARGGVDPGVPGQFFMVEAPGRLLPRPFSLCLAPRGELAFLVDAVGPGTRAIAAVEPGDGLHVLGPLGRGFRLDVARPLLVGGGIGIAPLPYLSQALGAPPAVLGFRTARHAEAASLVPNAEVVVEPTLVTDVLPAGGNVLACGPEPMLEALRARFPDAQLAWEAPMACGYGACYGCAVEIDGEWRRLCVEGPVLQNGGTHGSPVGRLLRVAGDADGSAAPAGRSPAPPATVAGGIEGETG